MKMEKIDNFYLAHPFEARKIVRPWELLVEKFFNINLINPIYDLYSEATKLIDDGLKTRYEKVDYIKLVERELEQIRGDGTKGVIMIQPGNFFSIGAYHEMVYTHNIGKPVYVLIMNGHHEHPWVKYHSTKIFTTWEMINRFLVDNFQIKKGFDKEEVFKVLSNPRLLIAK